MNARAQIVCLTITVMALLNIVACRSSGDDVTPTPAGPVETEVVESVDVEAVEEDVPADVGESLPAVVAQVETSIPASLTTSPSTQALAVTDTPQPDKGEANEGDAADDVPEPTATGTRRQFTVRTEVPTMTPVVATSTPTFGNVLLVPTPRTYTVKDGDTIRSIAHFCEVTIADLLDENDIDVEEADKIIPGQILRIPESN